MYCGVKSITRALSLCYGNSMVKIVSQVKSCWQPQSNYFWETSLRLETEHADVYVHHHVKTVTCIWGVCQSGTCNLYIMCLFIAFNVSGLSSSKCYTVFFYTGSLESYFVVSLAWIININDFFSYFAEDICTFVG